jgi:hypothetical protein
LQFCIPELFVDDFRFYLQIRELVSQTLILDAQVLPFLLAGSHFLFQ